MPLTAIIKSTGEQIIVPQDLARAKAYKEELICPICNEPVIPVRDAIRLGAEVQAYTRHKDIDGHYDTEYRYHTESREHKSAKLYLATHVSELLGMPVLKYEFEVRLPDIKRIADIRVQIDDDEYFIIEAQLSPTTPEELEERTNDYARLGYSVCWCLGKEAYKDYNYRWCLSNTGVCLVLSFHDDIDTNSITQRIAA
jgi:competence CoiA-like predicted nuclease